MAQNREPIFIKEPKIWVYTLTHGTSDEELAFDSNIIIQNTPDEGYAVNKIIVTRRVEHSPATESVIGFALKDVDGGSEDTLSIQGLLDGSAPSSSAIGSYLIFSEPDGTPLFVLPKNWQIRTRVWNILDASEKIDIVMLGGQF